MEFLMQLLKSSGKYYKQYHIGVISLEIGYLKMSSCTI